MIWTLILLGGVLLAGAAWAFAGLGLTRKAAGPGLLFRCPSCGQKLRYARRQAGQSGLCPRCCRRITVPAAAEAPPGGGLPAASYRTARRASA